MHELIEARGRPARVVRMRTLVGHGSPLRLHPPGGFYGGQKQKSGGLPFREAPRSSFDGGAENRTRVQKPTPVESTCLAASPLPVLLWRVRRPRVSEASKTPRPTSPDFSRPARLSTRARPAQLSDAPLRFA